MKKEESKTISVGEHVITAALIIVKVSGAYDIPWFWVFAPSWVSLLLTVLGLALIKSIAIISKKA
jgi:hypothetical protein